MSDHRRLLGCFLEFPPKPSASSSCIAIFPPPRPVRSITTLLPRTSMRSFRASALRFLKADRSILSATTLSLSPRSNSTMVSSQSPSSGLNTKVSSPAPPSSMSSPAPPFSVSLPSPPFSVSLPAPPLRVSLPSSPVSSSLPSSPCSVSLPAPPVQISSLPAPPLSVLPGPSDSSTSLVENHLNSLAVTCQYIIMSRTNYRFRCHYVPLSVTTLRGVEKGGSSSSSSPPSVFKTTLTPSSDFS